MAPDVTTSEIFTSSRQRPQPAPLQVAAAASFAARAAAGRRRCHLTKFSGAGSIPPCAFVCEIASPARRAPARRASGRLVASGRPFCVSAARLSAPGLRARRQPEGFCTLGRVGPRLLRAARRAQMQFGRP